jgi:MFS superfamily sulfate permease-like transporter
MSQESGTAAARPVRAPARDAPLGGWRALFPPAQWLAAYQTRWLANDAIAGVTLAAYGIPVSLAYASLAGLPPQYGIYCYLLGGLFYALFGSSRQLAIGPTSAISMLVGVTVAGMAQGDPGRWADIAALTALVIAAMCVLAWLLRLSSLVNFISETILLGFKAGAALTIAMTQLPKLFGVKGGGESFFERIVILAGQLQRVDGRFRRRAAARHSRRRDCGGARLDAVVIRRAAHPHVAFLGRIPGTRSYSDMGRNPGNAAVPGALMFRVEASLLYFHVDYVRDAVWQQIRSTPGPLTLVVCDLSTSPLVDLAGARLLAKLHAELQAAGMRLRLVAAHAAVRDILRAEGLEESIGYFGRRITVADVIDEFHGRTPAEAAAGLSASTSAS